MIPPKRGIPLPLGALRTRLRLMRRYFRGGPRLPSRGDLAPASCTSLTWGKWPIKPDIVMEAGNMARNLAVADPDYVDDALQLLSASKNFMTGNPLTSFGDTSAATALASRLAALVWAKYPNLRAETVRALLGAFGRVDSRDDRAVHFLPDGAIDLRSLVRCFGHGRPNVQNLHKSLHNSLTLIAESQLQPFFKDETDDNQKRVKTREMRLHPLPWPTEELTALQNTEVTMRVTLSYFVEPSPGARGWTPRYWCYQSHGFRFAVRTLRPDFQQRINGFARDEDYQGAGLPDPAGGSGMRTVR